jgi:hypothetical protein
VKLDRCGTALTACCRRPCSGVSGHRAPGAEDAPGGDPGEDDADSGGGRFGEPEVAPAAAEGKRELPGFEVGGGDADDGALQVFQVRMRTRMTIGVSTIISTTATVRCPSRDPRPRPTRNPTAVSSSIHSPVLTFREHGQVVDGLLSLKRDLAAARACFVTALRAGTVPVEITTDRAATSLPGPVRAVAGSPAHGRVAREQLG